MIDEVALVEHLKANPMFRVGLDVFEVKKQTPLDKFRFPMTKTAKINEIVSSG